MVEIDITDFVTDVDTWPLSGSRLTHGPDSAKETFEAAKEQAEKTPLLSDDKALKEMRAWMKASGGWTREEIAALSDNALNAIFIQLVVQDVREMGLENTIPDDFDWITYEADENSRGSIERGDNGKVYYSLEA